MKAIWQKKLPHAEMSLFPSLQYFELYYSEQLLMFIKLLPIYLYIDVLIV